MIRQYTLFTLCIAAFFLLSTGCEQPVPEGELPTGIKENIEWLADDERKGRLAGSQEEADAANFIADQFLAAGLQPAGDEGTFFQQFVLDGPMPQAMDVDNHVSRNVVGLIEGSENPDRYIILGAHYDGQGMGGIISMSEGVDPKIHNSADDNASGTAGLMELANRLTDYQPEKSILFVAFSGEELGLLGSRHFVENLDIDKESISAMINLDMIGRLSDGELTIFGTGTANVWDDLLDEIESEELSISRNESGSGASDHLSFYEADIPVLHYFTGTHEDYHRETDTADKINIEGINLVLDHVFEVVQRLDQTDGDEISFQSTNGDTGSRSPMMFDGPTLGVMPDYNYGGNGFRIDGVRENEPGAEAGLQSGDIIIQMGHVSIGDIYDYMESLEEFETGEEISLKILRDGEEMELKVVF